MTVSINGSGALTFNDASVQSTAATGFGFKNRIINGAMMIDQRNAGASVTPASGGSGTYTLDRWNCYVSQASKLTIQRSTTAPEGFINSLLVTSSSSYSVTSGDEFEVMQFVEGLNCQDLGFGTAAAKTVTLSFWVRSSLTGTFGGALQNSAANRSYPFSYTISSANTWEQKTITVAGDTTGTWLTTTGIGLGVFFGLGQGSSRSAAAGSWAAGNYNNATGATSVVGTSGATFYITGVDLRKGSVGAYSNGQNDFDYRPYGTELALCQRYYYRLTGGGVYFNVGQFAGITTNVAGGVVTLPVFMRTTPSGLGVSGTFTFNNAGINPTITIDPNTSSPTALGISASASGTIVQYRAYQMIASNGSSYYIETQGTEL